METFCQMLTGGHHNSLGRTEEVVALVHAAPARMEELYQCYFSDDEIVRLRTSSATKRVFAAKPDWFDDYADRLLNEITKIDQASARWTLAQLWLEHANRLTPDQMARAKQNLIDTLHNQNDWIALIMSMKTLGVFVKEDRILASDCTARTRELANDRRKSVSKYALKLLATMNEPVDLLK